RCVRSSALCRSRKVREPVRPESVTHMRYSTARARAAHARRSLLRLGAVIGALAAMVALAACGNSSGSAAAGAVAGSGLGSSSGSGSGKPINIGLVIDTTGSTKAIGDAFYRGAHAAAKLFGPI